MKLCYQKMYAFLLAMGLLLPFGVNAQWSSDPLQNLAIADTTGDQALPKIGATSDGGCYISWFDNRSGNYSVYLQRLNSQGEAQFQDKGMLVSDHPQQTFITDYDMTVDANDNAVIVFNDIRNGSQWDIFAYKIAPDGAFLWGPDGIGLSPVGNTDFEAAPKVAATSAGNFVVAWSKEDTSQVAVFQKISADGQKLWGTDGFTIRETGNVGITLPGVVAAENDSVVAFWERRTGNFPAFTIKLYTQKFAPDGSAAWDSAGVLIYDLGHISSFAEPLIYPDGNGGAFYTYYDSPSFGAFDVWVQHVSADGNLVFPVNGVKASTDVTRLHSEPTLSYLPQTDELFVFWLEKNSNQSEFGIYGQKFSPQGDRLWTDSGKQFIGLQGNQISFVRSAPGDNGVYVGYFQSSAPNAFDAAVKVFRLDSDGNYYWPSQLLSAASLGDKGRLTMAVNTENRAFLTWSDGRNDFADIYAQNINPDGTLGNPLTPVGGGNIHLPARFELAQNYPNPFNPSTTIRYSLPVNSTVRLTVYNVLGQEIRTLVNEIQNAGEQTVVWDGRDNQGIMAGSGLYIYLLQAGENILSRKMMLIQ